MERKSDMQTTPPTIRADTSSPEPGFPSAEAQKNKPNDSSDVVPSTTKDGTPLEPMVAAAFTESVQAEIVGEDDALIKPRKSTANGSSDSKQGTQENEEAESEE